jgi:hypothetical protein
MKTVILGLGSLMCFAAGGAFCWYSRPGWGWFLFVGFLLAGGVADLIESKSK